MPLRNDIRGLESLPMRLMVVAVVAALSVLPAANALESLQDKDFLTRAGLAANAIVTSAQILSMQGPGAARTLTLDLTPEGGLRVSKMLIGDIPGGPSSCAVVFELSSGARIVRLAEDPQAVMTSAAGRQLEVVSDSPALRMRAVAYEDWCAVVVEVV
jgi:hypothetical protein